MYLRLIPELLVFRQNADRRPGSVQHHDVSFGEAVGLCRNVADAVLNRFFSRFSMQFIDPEHDRVGIVTNKFHMFRGVRIACKAGIVNVCGIAAESNPLYLPNNMVRESLGVAKDFLAGNL